jgi:hypothetical protein
MISDADRARLADLAMRAIDTIIEDYGDDAELVAASLVFEVKVPDADGDEDEDRWHVNYKSLSGISPNHIAGILAGTAQWLQTPDAE